MTYRTESRPSSWFLVVSSTGDVQRTVDRLPLFRTEFPFVDGLPFVGPSGRHVDSHERMYGHAYTTQMHPGKRKHDALLATALYHSRHYLYSRRLLPPSIYSLSLPPQFAIPFGAFVETGGSNGRRAPPQWIYLGLPRPNLMYGNGTGEILQYRRL